MKIGLSNINTYYTSKVNPLSKTLDKNEDYVKNTFPNNGKSPIPGLPDSEFSNIISNLFEIDTSKVSNFLNSIFQIQESYAQFNLSVVKGEPRETNELNKYLEYPSKEMKELAFQIVNKDDSNDEKMYKIEQWVIENFDYEYDIKNYGEDEHWATPSETLRKGKGDCEDGAFLIHSLGLNAGVPYDRLRTYGGLVIYENENGGIESGGHAWTSYKSEEDNKWRVLDFSFFPTDKPINERQGMTEDMKYFDDYFFVNAKNTIDTPYSNAIRNPDDHNWENKGTIINSYI